MALEESLNKFKKQQANCQSTLVNIAPKQRSTNVPLGAQIKRVVDLLREKRKALTEEEIRVDCRVEKSAIANLNGNPRVNYDGKHFSYKELKNSNKIRVLRNFMRQDSAYPDDPRINIKVDDDLKQLFREMELPSDMLELEKDLRKRGMEPKTDTTRRRDMARSHSNACDFKKNKKKGEITSTTKLTNAHMPELFFLKHGGGVEGHPSYYDFL